MLKTPHPEGALLRNARHAQDISTTDAAAKAETTEQQWAHVETGEGRRAPADTIARMAHAVGIRAETLGAVRQDAALELEAIELQDHPGTPEFELKMRRLIDRLPESGDEVVRELRAGLEKAEASVRDLKRRVAELDARAAERKTEPKDLLSKLEAGEGYGRLRYVGAFNGMVLVSVVLGFLVSCGGYHFARWIAEASAPPGALVLMVELPGPFGGWVSWWWWISLAYFVVLLPIELVKARRDKLYAVPKKFMLKD